MPKRSKNKRRKSKKRARASAESAYAGEDRLGALPDELLQHVLSFLPANEAVATCVLSRRWRGFWKSVPVLRIANADIWESAEEFNNFVNHLLLSRGRAPLQALELNSYMYSFQKHIHSNEPLRFIDMWIGYAVTCHVRELRVCICSEGIGSALLLVYRHMTLADTPLITGHLMRLELECVELKDRFLDFSSCPALEYLVMNKCIISASKLLSRSLKHLTAMQCDFPCEFRSQISAPSLVSIRLDVSYGRTPLLESMPLLETAVIRLALECVDGCYNNDFGDCRDGECYPCYGIHDGGKCLLLRSLSNSTNLELAAQYGVGIFKRDLTWCPIFNKLKTLVLNEWCVDTSLRAIACFLEHSPILEKLILQLCEEPQRIMEVKGSCNPVEQLLFPSEHLKIVEVRCVKVDKWVHKILKILNAYGIAPDKINIQETNIVPLLKL